MKNVRKTIQGNYEARRMVNGCTVSAYGSTATIAMQKLDSKIIMLEANETECITFAAWLTEWLEVYKMQNVTAPTLRRLKDCIRLHIPQAIQNTPLNLLKPLEIQKALNAVPLSRTRKATYDIYAESLRKAYEMEFIPSNIIAKVTPIKHKRKQGTALTKNERIEFLKTIRGTKYEHLFIFYLTTGARRNEALSLTWQDIDFTENWLHIRGTKTAASVRTIQLMPEAKAALLSQQQTAQSNALVFPYNPDFITHEFKRLCPTHKLHDLRHTFATICYERGIMLSTAQHWLGHASIETTSSVYTHVLDDFQRQEAKKFKL